MWKFTPLIYCRQKGQGEFRGRGKLGVSKAIRKVPMRE